MHTFHSHDKYHFHHNGDFSGDVFITYDDMSPDDEPVKISSQALLEYAHYVIDQILIEKIENIL